MAVSQVVVENVVKNGRPTVDARGWAWGYGDGTAGSSGNGIWNAAGYVASNVVSGNPTGDWFLTLGGSDVYAYPQTGNPIVWSSGFPNTTSSPIQFSSPLLSGETSTNVVRSVVGGRLRGTYNLSNKTGSATATGFGLSPSYQPLVGRTYRASVTYRDLDARPGYSASSSLVARFGTDVFTSALSAASTTARTINLEFTIPANANPFSQFDLDVKADAWEINGLSGNVGWEVTQFDLIELPSANAVPFTLLSRSQASSYRVSYRVWSSQASTGRVRIVRSQGNGFAEYLGRVVTLPANTWTTITDVLETPGAASGPNRSTDIMVQVRTPNNAPSHTIRVSELFAIPLEPGQDYTGPYFDGNTTNTLDTSYSWTGQANASSSISVTNYPDEFVGAATTAAFFRAIPPPVPVGVVPRNFRPVNLLDYKVDEEATPLTGAGNGGGVSEISVTVPEDENTVYLSDIPIELTVPSQGITRGTVKDPSASDGVASISAVSRLGAANVTRNLPPMRDTLEAVIRAYLASVGITDGLVMQGTQMATVVAEQGFSGNVYDRLKDLCSVHRLEMSLVSNNVVFRPLRGRIAENYRGASVSWSSDSSRLAQSVVVNYYTNQYAVDRLAWPIGGWSTDTQTLTVEQGTTQVYTLETDASLLTVQQPVIQTFVAKNHTGSSVYTVAGSDGLPIPPAQWSESGGRLTIEIGEDTTSIIVTITAPSSPQHATFSISVNSGVSDTYSTLRVVGTGIFYKARPVRFDSNLSVDIAPTEIGTTIENRSISSREQAVRVGMWALKGYSMPSMELDVDTRGINRVDDNGSYAYPTVAKFNEVYAGLTVADFNTQWAGKTFGEFNTYMNSLVTEDFANQAFGNVAGARVMHRGSWKRIVTASNGPDGVSYSAEDDTTVEDFNTIYAGMTVDDFNNIWAGYSFGDFNTTPLELN